MSWETRKKKCNEKGFIHYCNRPAHFLTDKYIINKLYAEGIPREATINNPELIEAERQKLKLKRLIKYL
jgi:hypothetical protein